MSLIIRRRVPKNPNIVGKEMGFWKNNTAQVMCQNPVCYYYLVPREGWNLEAWKIACRIVRVCVHQVKSVESNNVLKSFKTLV